MFTIQIANAIEHFLDFQKMLLKIGKTRSHSFLQTFMSFMIFMVEMTVY